MCQHTTPDKVGFSQLTGAVLVASRHGQDAGVRPLSPGGRPRHRVDGWRAEGGRGQLSRSSVVMRVAAGTKKVQIAETRLSTKYSREAMRLEVAEREPCFRAFKVVFTVTTWHTPGV